MKEAINLLFSDKIIRIGVTISLVILFIILVIVLIYYRNLPPVIPIYNQMPWGESRLGSKLELFFPLLLTVFFFVLNLLFALYGYRRMPLVSRTLTITGLLLVIITFIFTFRTIQLIH